MKKRFITILITTIFGSIVFAQNAVLTLKEQENISEVVSIIDDALKQSNTKVLNNYLAENFTSMGYEGSTAKEQVLPQMFIQLPKGELKILKTIKKPNKEFNLDIIISPMQVALDIVLNSNFKITKLNVIQDNVTQNNPSENEKRREQISIPFHLVDGFILVEAEINGKRGKLMFDTGNPNNLLLNNNYLELNKGNKISSGMVGSGQKIEVYQDEVNSVNLGLDYKMGSQIIQHADFSFTQIGITSDMMGFLGYDFIKDYEFMIDYDNQIIEMYLISENQENKFYNEDDIVVELNFSTPFMPNIPYVDFVCNGKKITANFDTGNQGNLNLSKNKIKEFVKSGIINEIQSNGVYGQSAKVTKYTIDDLNYNSVKLDKIKSMMNNKESGIPNTKESKFDVGVGYQFLKNYRSIWNFSTKKIILLSR